MPSSVRRRPTAGGAWSKSLGITRSRSFLASINGDAIYSEQLDVMLASGVEFVATALGGGRVRLSMNGRPDAVTAGDLLHLVELGLEEDPGCHHEQ